MRTVRSLPYGGLCPGGTVSVRETPSPWEQKDVYRALQWPSRGGVSGRGGVSLGGVCLGGLPREVST